MLAIPGSVHIGSARSTRSAIQVLAPHLESAVFISCNLEPWRLGRDRFELREMFGSLGERPTRDTDTAVRCLE